MGKNEKRPKMSVRTFLPGALQLEADGILSSFISDERKGEKSMETPQQADDVSLSDSSEDSDYVPPEKQALKEIKPDKL